MFYSSLGRPCQTKPSTNFCDGNNENMKQSYQNFNYLHNYFSNDILVLEQLSSKSQDEVQSQVQTPKLQNSKAPLDFCLLYSQIFTPPHPTPPHPTHPTHPTLNFSNTSRGPTPKCYTFLETSHDPRLGSKLRCKNFANFFATLFHKVKSKSRKSQRKSQRKERLDFAYPNFISPPTHPTPQ